MVSSARDLAPGAALPTAMIMRFTRASRLWSKRLVISAGRPSARHLLESVPWTRAAGSGGIVLSTGEPVGRLAVRTARPLRLPVLGAVTAHTFARSLPTRFVSTPGFRCTPLTNKANATFLPLAESVEVPSVSMDAVEMLRGIDQKYVNLRAQ